MKKNNLTAISASILAIGAGLSAGAALLQPVVITDARAHPESITSTSDGTLFIGSFNHGSISRAAPGAAKAEIFIKPSDGYGTILGVLADETAGTLWACAAHHAPAGEALPPEAEPTSLTAYDLKSGALKGRYPLPGKATLCNDIAVGSDGAAYVTDSRNPHILRLKPGAKALEVWAEDSRMVGKGGGPGLDGIAFADKSTLFVNTFTSGMLFRVALRPDGTAGAVTPIVTSKPLTLPDALRPTGTANSFLMIEGAGRLDRVVVSGDKAEISVLKDGFDSPAGVAVTGATAWVVEAKLGYLSDPKLKDQSPPPFVAHIVKLEK